MTPDANAAFTEALRARLEADPRVVGLAALGSMARRDYEPDRYRVLLDRADLQRRLADLAAATAATGEARADDAWLLGQFLTSLLVGAARHIRGERLSGRLLVASHAVRPLLILLARHVPSGRRDLSDDLDPFRRFELIYPELGGELGAVLSRDTRAAALGLLEIASRELASRIRGFPSRAAEAVGRRIEEP